jgi:hypothetical protein
MCVVKLASLMRDRHLSLERVRDLPIRPSVPVFVLVAENDSGALICIWKHGEAAVNLEVGRAVLLTERTERDDPGSKVAREDRHAVISGPCGCLRSPKQREFERSRMTRDGLMTAAAGVPERSASRTRAMRTCRK